MNRAQTLFLILMSFMAACFLYYEYRQQQHLSLVTFELNLLKNQVSTLSPYSLPATPTASLTLSSQLSSLTQRLDRLENQSTPSVKPIALPIPQASYQKQILTLGAGSTNNTSWIPTGLEITLNSTDYPPESVAYFEAGLNIVNGIAYARLTNKTTGAVINLSEVSHNTNTVTWVRSGSFKLHPGTNSYRVELRSSSSEVMYLSGSHLVIALN